jgi:hypothetical protein
MGAAETLPDDSKLVAYYSDVQDQLNEAAKTVGCSVELSFDTEVDRSLVYSEPVDVSQDKLRCLEELCVSIFRSDARAHIVLRAFTKELCRIEIVSSSMRFLEFVELYHDQCNKIDEDKIRGEVKTTASGTTHVAAPI